MDDEQELQDATWLQPDDDIAGLLRGHGWIDRDEPIIRVEPAGDGNMNWTLRVTTPQRSLILKQSRPWVAKFPSIPAPVERALFELRFYETVAKLPSVSSRMPRLLGAAPDQFLLALEDLGAARDGSGLYNAPIDLSSSIGDRYKEQIEWLASLHLATRTKSAPESFRNLELRKLNHEHIFKIPFSSPPTLDLDAITPGLAKAAAWVQSQPSVVETAYELGRAYLLAPELGSDTSLLHGDFFPGSWLYSEEGVKVIDPEFCYHGPPEFDLGVLVAHLVMIGEVDQLVQQVCERYESCLRDASREPEAGDSTEPYSIDRQAVCRWAGVEVIRRLLGYAQLPLNRDLAEKRQLLELSVRLMSGTSI